MPMLGRQKAALPWWAHAERIPVILNGFLCAAAASALEKTAESALDYCVAGHVSSEQAHKQLLDHFNEDPLLALGLQLGEGTGGALAISVLKGAFACHSGVPTFAEASVSGR